MARFVAVGKVSLGGVAYTPIGFEKQPHDAIWIGQEFEAEAPAVQKLLDNGVIKPYKAGMKELEPVVAEPKAAPKKGK